MTEPLSGPAQCRRSGMSGALQQLQCQHGPIIRVALAGWTREEVISVRHAPLD
jgi:hypothetical protein